ncbi:putative leucine-rich repeat-containing protein DDB_G0290503 [Physella acuta]|uniref:putative leucine-rich repeat-containing protein DDB_G0290503 n=1 Tax=Physella acuta TaxID=109671 RepID=UPI0027DC95CC|nr:putative leucine-rich repeat-containing protein DDB_G0290503 [Physella acuta]
MECVDKTSETNLTMKDAITMVAAAQSTLLEQADVLAEFTKLNLPMVVMREKTTPEEGVCNSETIRRLQDIEITLNSLRDTKQKTEDDISEIKQWRDKFVAEQSTFWINMEELSKNLKDNFKTQGEQIIEQDNKIKELNQQINSLKTKESDTDKTMEKLSLDMIEYENNLHTLNKEMRVYTEKTDHVTQEIQKHSDLISAKEKDGLQNNRQLQNTLEELLSKYVVICKILQQRLVPIDKLIEVYNQNSEARGDTMKMIDALQIDFFKLRQDFQKIVANQQVKQPMPGFIASNGRCDAVDNLNYKVITFESVERDMGNNFNPATGEFTAPVDGLYVAKFTIQQEGFRSVGALLKHKFSTVGDVHTNSQYAKSSGRFNVRMKSGDVLYLNTYSVDCICTHFSCFFQSE